MIRDAYHIAGHCVAADVTQEFTRDVVSIHQPANLDCPGCQITVPRYIQNTRQRGKRRLEYLRKQCVIAQAGYQGEMHHLMEGLDTEELLKLRPKPSRLSNYDRLLIGSISKSLKQCGVKDPEAFIDEAGDRAMYLINEHTKFLELLAKAFLARQTLTAREILDIKLESYKD